MLLIPLKDERYQLAAHLFSTLAVQAPNLFHLVKQPETFQQLVLLDHFLKHSFPSEQEKLKTVDPAFYQKLTSTLNVRLHQEELSNLIALNQALDPQMQLDEAKITTMTYLDWLITAGMLYLRQTFTRQAPLDPAQQTQLDRLNTLSPPFVTNKQLRPFNAFIQQIKRQRDQRSFWLELTGFMSVLTSVVWPFGLIITAACAFTYKRIQLQYRTQYNDILNKMTPFDQALTQLDMADTLNTLLDMRNDHLLHVPLYWLLCYQYLDTAPQHFDDLDIDLLIRMITSNPKTALSLISNLNAKELPDILHPSVDIDIFQKLQSGFNANKKPLWLVGKDSPHI